MKKKIKILSLIIAFSGIGLTFASQSAEELTDLFAINNAEAVCCTSPIDNGHCTFTMRCVPNPGGTITCDSTLGECRGEENGGGGSGGGGNG